MRTKKDKEKPNLVPSQRHSTAATYDIGPQGGMMEYSDEYILDLFEQMLVRKIEELCKRLSIWGDFLILCLACTAQEA